MCDEFRMLLNSLWMIWIILYFLQNYAMGSKYLALRVLEAGLKISDETCREGNMLVSTNMMDSLCQTHLWNTDGIWLYTVANNLVCQFFLVVMNLSCKSESYLFTLKSVSAAPRTAFSLLFYSSSHFLEYLVTFLYHHHHHHHHHFILKIRVYVFHKFSQGHISP